MPVAIVRAPSVPDKTLPFAIGSTPTPARGFAQLPHDIAADPRLNPTDVRLVAILLFFARADSSCWPSDKSLGKRIGRKRATVQRHLRALEACGYILRVKTRSNPTGRIIRLLWRETPPVSAPEHPPVSPVSDDPEKQEKSRTRAGAVGTPPASREREKPPQPEDFATMFASWLDRPAGDPLRDLAIRRIALRR